MTRAARSILVFGIYLVGNGLIQLAPPVLIVFGLVDAAGAMWTRAALVNRPA